MDPLINHGFVAVNVYFSGVCNLQCKYCFQPKIGSKMRDVNNKIIEWIDSGKMEDDIEKYIGKDIECLALWGGEPSLNLPHLVKRLESIYQRFPKFNSISFSTNIAKKFQANNIIQLIDAVRDLNGKLCRKVHVDVQFSIDGPPEVNDKDRIGSKATEILDNVAIILEHTKGYSSKLVRYHFKGTQSADTFHWMVQPNEKYGTNLEYYYRFFDDYLADWQDKGYTLPSGLGAITLVYPGHYTQEDGKIYRQIVNTLLSEEWKNKDWKVIHDFGTQTTDRIEGTIRTLKRGVRRAWKGEMLSNCTCSAGRSCAGISYDGKYHWCQSTFFFDANTRKYLEESGMLTDFEKSQGYSFRNFDNYIKDYEVVSYEDDLRLSRTLSNMNLFWNNISLRLQYVRMQIDVLAQAGQISPIFLEEKWASLATAFFIFGGNECPADNCWEFGSVFVKDNSQMKLILNGVFEDTVNRLNADGVLE